jgi:hypothetical protein
MRKLEGYVWEKRESPGESRDTVNRGSTADVQKNEDVARCVVSNQT